MKLFRPMAIVATVSFFLASFYGLYTLVVCENHALTHSFLGAACPRSDFLRSMTAWRQMFSGILTGVALVLLFILLLGFVMRLLDVAEEYKRALRFLSARTHFLEIKPRLSLFQFLFRGRLNPEIYKR